MIAKLKSYARLRIDNSRVFRSVLTIASGTALAQIIAICTMPVVTRLYSPAEIGVLNIFTSFFSFWAASLSLRYEYALLIVNNDDDSHILFRLSIICVFLMTLLAAPILWLLCNFKLLGFELFPLWAIGLMVPSLFGYGIFMVYRSWALRAGLIKDISRATVARATANSGLQVILGVSSFGLIGLLIAQLAGSWAAMFRLAKKVNIHFYTSKPDVITSSNVCFQARRFSKFSLYETPSTWADQFGLALPVFIVAMLHGAVAAGWFGLARMLVSIPNTQIGGAVGDVFQVELAKAVVASDHSGGRRLFYSFVKKLAVVGIFPLILVITFAPVFVPLLLGKNWTETGLVAAIIAPWLYAALVVSPLSRVLSILQMQEYKLVYDVSMVLLLFLTFLVSKAYVLSFIQTVIAISIAGFIGYIVYVFILIFVIERKLGGHQEHGGQNG